MNRNEPASLATTVTKDANPVLPDLGYEPTEGYSHYPRRMWCLLPLEGRNYGPNSSNRSDKKDDANCDLTR